MALETWVAFALAAQVVLLIPGPTILLVVAYSLSHGRMATVPLVIGVGLGDLTAMVFSFVGLGVLLQTVAAFFAVFKWAGAESSFGAPRPSRWNSPKSTPLPNPNGRCFGTPG